MRQHQVVGFVLAMLTCALEVGCTYDRTAAYATHRPRLVEEIPRIASLEITAYTVHIVARDERSGLIAGNGDPLRDTTVRCGESFECFVFNGKAKYELQGLEDNSAVFKVKRGFMSCVCPFVKHTTTDLIRVRPYMAN